MAYTIYDTIIKQIKFNCTFKFLRYFVVISKVGSLGDISDIIRGYNLELAKVEGKTRG